MKKNLLNKFLSNFLSKFLLTILISTTIAHAGLYKGLDADGNVAYSDKPFDSAKEITPPTISVIEPVKVEPKEIITEKPTDEVFKYKKFSIDSPIDQQTIWNNPALGVSLNLKPALNTAAGHKIWLFMDGKPIIKNSNSLTLEIGRTDRGEHQLQAHIRNKAGKVIKQTKTITIHIKNTVVKRGN
jgi:hypothetical protein